MINAVPNTPQTPGTGLGQAMPTLGGAPVAGAMPVSPTTPAANSMTPAVAAPMGMPAGKPMVPPAPMAPTATPTPSASAPKGPTPPMPPAPPRATAPDSMTPPQPKKKAFPVKGILAALAIVVVLASGAFGVLFINRSQDQRNAASVGTTTPGCNSPCTDNTQCPAAHTCATSGANAGRCVLSACLQSGTQCNSTQCVQTNVGACSLNFVAVEPPTQITCDKTAYRDEFSNTAGNYAFTQKQTTFEPGDTVVFNINTTNQGSSSAQITLTDPLNTGNLSNFTFLDSSCGPTAYNTSTRTLTCPAFTASPGASVVRAFRVRLADNVAAGSSLTNTANITSGAISATCSATVTIAGASPSPSPTPSPTPTPTPNTYTCNGSCTTDQQCQSLNASYVCDVAAGNRCRLDSNRTSTTCTPAENTYACNSPCTTDAQCQTANSAYTCSSGLCRLSSNPTASNCQPQTTPTPAVGCNQVCATNADCANASHVCTDTTEGRRCRLENYPNSTTCTPPSTPVVTASTAPQPVQPTKLPVAGAADNTAKFLMVGAAAVILGALGLLIL